MKLSRLIFVAALIPVSTTAADILLSDGRVLQDAVITSQTPRAVFVRHKGGLSSIKKELLPADLRAKYPVDEAGARKVDEAAEIARQQAAEFQKAEAFRAAKLRTNDSPPPTESSSDSEKRAKKLLAARVKTSAAALAEDYFKQLHVKPGQDTICAASITEMTEVEGWPNHWRITGRVTISYQDTIQPQPTFTSASDSSWRDSYNSQSYYGDTWAKNDGAPIGDASWRAKYNSNNLPVGVDPASPTRDYSNATRHDRIVRDTTTTYEKYRSTGMVWNESRSSSSEIKEFEGYYAEDPAPSVDVAIR